MLRLGLIAVVAVLSIAPAHARILDLSKPEDIIRAEMRIDCTADPAKPRLRWMSGKIMARRQGEKDLHIFDVQGLNAAACRSYDDPKRGPGYRQVTRESIFYIDPATGKVLDTWKNPWIGETVEVVHMFNDPVNMAEPKYAYDKDGKPLPPWPGKIVGGNAMVQVANPFFRDSPMGGDYQDFVGGKYSVLELRTILYPVAEWLDTDKPSPVRNVAVWSRLSPWLPWMKMAGREGETALTSTWFGVGGMDEVPEPLRTTILTKYPMFATAPPLDDPRPSVSSWNGVQAAIDRQRGKTR